MKQYNFDEEKYQIFLNDKNHEELTLIKLELKEDLKKINKGINRNKFFMKHKLLNSIFNKKKMVIVDPFVLEKKNKKEICLEMVEKKLNQEK